MRSVSGRWAAAVRSSHAIATWVDAWYGPTLLARVPVSAGQLDYDATARGRRRCQLTVPLYDGGTRWDPGNDPRHPLATYGQRLHIRTGIAYPGGNTELMNHGWYLITETHTESTAGTVTVTGSDLYQLLTDSRIISNPWGGFGPPNTYMEVVERLTYVGLKNPFIDDPQIVPYAVSPDLSDRQLAGAVETDEQGDRTEVLNTLCRSWPADHYINDNGDLWFAPPVTGPAPDPVAHLNGDTADSTVTGRGRSTARQRIYNAVYTAGIDPETGDRRAVGRAEITDGPLDIRGPYGWVSRWYSSPLLATDAQATKAAATLLAKGAIYSRTEEITAVPDAALEVNDTVAVTTEAGGTFTGLVSSLTLPLTATGGPMTLTVTNQTETETDGGT